MEISKAILSRRSIRSFRPEIVSDDKIREMVKAATYAPSAGNCQPWHFYIIKDTIIKNKIYKEACHQELIESAPVLITVCTDPGKDGTKYGKRGQALYNIQDTAAAVQNILLSATGMGPGSCWCGDFNEEKLKEILGMDSTRTPVAIIAAGYAQFEPAAPLRKPVDEVSTFIGGFEDNKITEQSNGRKIEHTYMAGTVFNDVNLYGADISDVKWRT